jgi:hypothetical protein
MAKQQLIVRFQTVRNPRFYQAYFSHAPPDLNGDFKFALIQIAHLQSLRQYHLFPHRLLQSS